MSCRNIQLDQGVLCKFLAGVVFTLLECGLCFFMPSLQQARLEEGKCSSLVERCESSAR